MKSNMLFVDQLAKTIETCSNEIAIKDYEGESCSYGELSEKIMYFRDLWSRLGLKSGNKIAICCKSSSFWIEVFLSVVTDWYVAVLLPETEDAKSIQKLVNHSESVVLCTTKDFFQELNFSDMPNLLAVVDVYSGEVLTSKFSSGNQMPLLMPFFVKSHNNGDLCLISYTSGTSGHIKAVMLSFENISYNVMVVEKAFPYKKGASYLSVLPYSHILGLVYDALSTLCVGMMLVVFGNSPIPRLLLKALSVVNPCMFISVPLVLKKIIDYALSEFYFNQYETDSIEMKNRMMRVFGSDCQIVATGGGPLPKELETFIVCDLHLPFFSGYGMTECAPTICLGSIQNYKVGSCGKNVDGVKLLIDSYNLEGEGELLVKSPGVFLGYYKDESLTKQSFTSDGWFKTGDICKIDEDGNVFILGRCKNVIVTSNGINVYPEEIESIINSMSFVKESLAVQREDRIVAIVRLQDGILFSQEILNRLYEVNRELPYHSMVSDFEITDSPFEKTSKGTTKRYLYGGVREK